MAKKNSAVFAYIMRLRQLCLHPLLFIFGKLRNQKDPISGQYLLNSPNRLDVNEVLKHYQTVVKHLQGGATFNIEGLDARAVQIVQLVLRADIEPEDCCICLESLENGKHVKTQCKHSFHMACIQDWLGNHDNCPLCRQPLENSMLQELRIVDQVAVTPLPPSVGAFLSSVNPNFAQKYSAMLSSAGFDSPAVLVALQENDLRAIGVPESDAKSILKAVARLNGAKNDEKGKEECGEKSDEEEHDNDDEKGFFEQKEGILKSTKLELLLHVLQNIVKDEPDSKILVFTQFTSFIDLIQEFLNRADLGMNHCRIDGTMSLAERSNQIFSFRTDPDKKIFLLSLKVASLGLNLTAANRVILLDPWFNPSVEQQAIDRVVRFGQTRGVKVLRLFISNSIEDRLREIQEKKLQITASVLNEDLVEQSVQQKRSSVSNIRMWRELFR